MVHKFISLYKVGLNEEVIQAQKKVFDKFEIPIQQISFEGYHDKGIEDYLNNNKDYDIVTIFDVDCIPIKYSFLSKILNNVVNSKVIYGNAQSSNTYSSNKHKSLPYIAPSFISFTRELYETSPTKSFKFENKYPNPEGVLVESDVAEVFCRENEKRGVQLVYAYPTVTHGKPYWENDGRYGTKPFKFGQGTEYESDTYHHFTIRDSNNHTSFIEYCNKIINEN
jgi:hypothetical protein